MPIVRQLTESELNHLAQQGVDPNLYRGKEVTLATDDEIRQPSANTQQPDNTISKTGAAVSTLKSHGGGIAGGGIASLIAGSYLLGPEVGLPATVLGLIGTALAGAGGAYAGQKAQNAIQGEEVTQKLAEEQAQAEEQHPWVTGATDIAASALAAGGAPSLNALKAGRGVVSKLIGKAIEEGDKNAIKAVAMNSVINPAINTGVEYATTGNLPTVGDLAAQAVGGAVMSGQSPFGKFVHERINGKPEPVAEPAQKGTATEVEKKPEVVSPWTEKSENDQYIIGNDDVKNAFVKANPKPANPSSQYDTEGYTTLAKYKQMMKTMTPDEMRNRLHQDYLKSQELMKKIEVPEGGPVVEPKGEPTVKIPEEKKPIVSEEQLKKTEEELKSKVQPKLPTAEELSKPIVEAYQKDNEAKKVPVEQGTQADTSNSFLRVAAPGVVNIHPDEHVLAGQAPEGHANGEPNIKEEGEIHNLSQPGVLNMNPDNHLENQRLDAEGKAYAPKSDFQQYNELNTKLRQMIQSGNTTSDEFIKTWKEMENIKNKNGGMPPKEQPKIEEPYVALTPDNIPQFLAKSGTAKDELAKIASNSKDEYNDIAKHLLSIMDKDGLGVKVLRHEDFADGGVYSHGKNEYIGLYPENESWETIHEVAHAATIKKIRSLGEDHPVVKELNDCLNEAREKLGYKLDEKGNLPRGNKLDADTIYGMRNLYEFIAQALSRKKFQESLNNIETKSGTIWSRIVNAVRKLLGVDVKHGSMLERVLKPIDELTQMERPSTEVKGEDKAFAPPSPTDVDITPRGGIVHSIFGPMVDKIRSINHPLAKEVGNAFQKTLQERDQRVGATWNKIMDTVKKVGLTRQDQAQLQKISEYENLHGKAAPAYMFQNQRQKQVYDVERAVYDEVGKYRIANKEPVYAGNSVRMLKQDPYAHPTTPDPKIIETYRKGEDAAQIAKLDKIFLDNGIKHGLTPAEAQENLDNFKKGIAGSMQKGGSNLQFYNAARRAQGTPLPPEFARKDYLKNLEVYYHRQAMDNSFYKNVEANPNVMSALGETHDAWNQPIPKDPTGGIAKNPAVESQLNEIRGDVHAPGEYNEKALSSLATTLFIGPGTTIHKLVSNAVGVTNIADNPYQLTRMLGAMLTDWKSGIEHVKENGVIKLTARSVHDIFNANSTMAERLQALAHTTRGIYSLGDLTDKWGAGLMQAGIEGVATMKLAKANKGDVTNQKWFKNLDPDYVVGKNYTPEEISKLASAAVQQIHGTGDGRTMPAWMSRDTEISGFFKLSNWGISQTNRFLKQIYEPATRGDVGPLLNAMFGAAIGGYMIKELRESLQGKKGQIPSLTEIASSERGTEGNIPLVGYNLMAALSYAGFGGMLTQMGKIPLDILYKNHPQGATFPLDEFVGDVAKTVSDATSAIANDPNLNWLLLAEHVTGHLLTQNFQLGRTVYNQAINNGLIAGDLADKKLLSDKMGQLRRFNMVSNLPYIEQEGGAGNQFMNLEQKSFKLEQNPEEAVKQLPGLINGIVEKYGNSPDVMMQKIKALKQNQYATMPNPDTTPLSFFKYISYLTRMEGPEQANAALMDYMKHKMINEAKSSVVP